MSEKMTDEQINKIAEALAAKLAEPGGKQLLGCGSASSNDYYRCDGTYSCASYYECGGESSFMCMTIFTCEDDFSCDQGFGCMNSFDCEGSYTS